MIIPIILLTLFYFATIFFGGAHVWAQSILILAVLVLMVIVLWKSFFEQIKTGRRAIRIIKDPISLVGVLFLIWVAFSLIPLSSDFLKTLSPQTFRLWETTALVGGQFPRPLSLYPYMTINSGLFCLGLLCFYWLALYGNIKRRQIHFLVLGILILGTVESLYALIQLALAKPYVLWWRKDVSEAVATGTFIYRNHFACFLSMIICLGVGYLWALLKENEDMGNKREQAWVYRAGIHMGALGTRGIVLLLALALMLAGLLTTASRGGVVTFTAGLVFMAGLLMARFFKSQKSFILLFGLALVFTYVGYVAFDRVLERFYYFANGFEDRLAMAKATYRMGKSFPLTGTGLGSFEFVFPGFQERSIEVLVDYAHNDWVQLFAETGIVGLALIGGGLIWFMGRSIALWRRRRDPFSVGIALGGMGAMVAVALHSLSDFNLHLPANALLLAFIIVLIYFSLHSQKHHNQETFSGQTRSLRFPVWVSGVMVILITIGAGSWAYRTIQIWRADSLARTVWNSTQPFQNPTDRDLFKAWSLAPGNAAYWAWQAQRAAKKPSGNTKSYREILGKKSVDLNIYLLGEGIKRNPTAWNIWRELGWAAFFKGDKDPGYYPFLALQAFEQASRLRPYAPSGHFESGVAGLAVYAQQGGKGEKGPWQEAFKRALQLNPILSARVADQLILYLGPNGPKEVKGLLPMEAHSYLIAGVYLLKAGIFKEGLECLTEGERFREREVERLWEEVSRSRNLSQENKDKVLTEILLLDPLHPGALLTNGRILEALRIQDRRSGILGELADRKELAWNLKLLEDQKKGSVAEIAYFLGRLAAEEGDLQGARFQYQRSLQDNPQFFPPWIHLEKILAKLKRTAGDQIEWENLQKRIQFFQMEQLAGDAWTGDGVYQEFTRWKTSYRTGQRQDKMEINFSGELDGAWKLLLDGRFVAAWAGSSYRGEKKMMIPEGEHEFKLICFMDLIKKAPEKLPFKLSIKFN